MRRFFLAFLMAIAVVASVQKGGTGASAAIDTSGASLLVAFVSDSGTPTPTDSKGNTWANLTGQSGDFSEQGQLWYAVNPTVGSGHTFNANGSVAGLTVVAFSGVKTSLPFDQQNGVGSATSPSAGGSVTPSENDELVVSAMGGLAASGASINGGFTIQEELPATLGNNYSSALAYLVQTTAAAASPSWTWTTVLGTSSGICNATFKAAAAAGGATVELSDGGILTHGILTRGGALVH